LINTISTWVEFTKKYLSDYIPSFEKAISNALNFDKIGGQINEQHFRSKLADQIKGLEKGVANFFILLVATREPSRNSIGSYKSLYGREWRKNDLMISNAKKFLDFEPEKNIADQNKNIRRLLEEKCLTPIPFFIQT